MILSVNKKIRVNGFWEACERKIGKRVYFKDFSNGFYRMIYVSEGSVIFRSGEERLILRSGEVVVRKGEDISFAESTSQKSAKVMVISFDVSGALTDTVCAAPQKLTIKGVEKLTNVISLLKNEGGSPSNFLQNEKSGFLHELANTMEIFFLSLTENKEEIQEEKIRLSNEYKEIVDIMRANVEKPLTVKEIAALCGMSESTLKKIFAKYSACSVHKYFLKMKVYKAIELLDNKYNVAEISEKLSFNNQNYFGIVFKKETGYSPLNYRKKFLRGM